MKNIQIFPTLKEYRKFIFSKIITRPEFKKNNFYRGLTEFVIDHRSPIFFNASEDCEYAHFTQYFNWVLIRGGYKNLYLQDLYFLHDFVHMIFDNPLHPNYFNQKSFREVVVANERVAANETEIGTYYRLPEIRKKTLNKPILYDFLKKRYKTKPSVDTLFNLRNRLIETNYLPKYLDNPEGKMIVSFLKRFKNNNKTWTGLWREEFPDRGLTSLDRMMTLSLRNYGEFLEKYRGMNSQKQYEENVLFNIRLGLSMLGYKKLPKSFSEALKMKGVFEDQILMKPAAEKYHSLYSLSKDREKREIKEILRTGTG